MRTIARWKSGLLPLEVFAMRVNWDTQRISPCISLTFAFHMSPEELENTFKDSLCEGPSVESKTGIVSNRVNSDKMTRKSPHFLGEILNVSGIVICVMPIFSLFHRGVQCVEWHLPTPMPTSTINPREISDTISLFTEGRLLAREDITVKR